MRPYDMYLRLGDMRASLKFPFIWWGFKEYVWRFILIFCGMCAVVAAVLFSNFGGSSVILFGVAFAAVNSILEGALWRGLILGRLVDLVGETQGLIISSLAFGFYHISLGFSVLICLIFAVGGFYMGGCAIKSRGLFAPIVMHFFVNMIFVLRACLVSFRHRLCG